MVIPYNDRILGGTLMNNFWRILLVYSAVASTALVFLVGHHWRTRGRGRFEEITVQRINVV